MGITRNRDTGISTGITVRHCNCMFHAARRGLCWIIDPVQTAYVKGYCDSNCDTTLLRESCHLGC